MSATYFAYGSNLSSDRLLGRCPAAGRPRAAVLTGHVWLINERGVATIEPSDGHDVHGVVWDVTDDDLTALDGFEGTVVAVSHDRAFLRTMDRFVFVPHSGAVAAVPDHRAALEALSA